jgi:outer membrane protein assembly factor BamB
VGWRLAFLGLFSGATFALAADPSPPSQPPQPSAPAEKAPVSPSQPPTAPAPPRTGAANAAVQPAAKDLPASGAPAEAHAALVKQLADNSYEKRHEAAVQLAAQGLAAQKAIQAGLRDPDVEVRRCCRRLLVQVLEADFSRRLDELLADNEGKKEHALPCWKRYAEVFGKDKEARQAFVDMQRAETALMESAEVGDELATQILRLRWQQVFQWMFGNQGQPNQQPGFGSLAALLFVSVDMEVKVPPELANNNMCVNVFHQGAFQQALNDSARKAMARKLLGRWIRQPTGQQFVIQKLQLAMQYQVKEALGIAVDLLKSNAANNAQMMGYGIEAVARLGGKPYGAMLVPLLKDNRECMRHIMMVNNKQEIRSVEVRDVALAWLIELTGQDHAQYDMPEVKQWFENLRRFPQNMFNFFNMGFQDASKREVALKKLQEWLKSNPPAEPPPVPAAEGQPPPAPRVAPGQPVMGPQPVQPKEAAGSVSVVGLAMADRAQTRKLAEAKRLIDRESYTEATNVLGEILSAPADFAFKPDPAHSLYRRLKPAAENLLGQLPEEGLRGYELQFGASGRQKLAEATAAGSPLALARVVESFFYTEAGAEAAYLLGTHHRNVGQPLLAAFLLQRLESEPRRAARFQPALSLELAACYLRCRMPKSAREVLLRLKAANPTGTVPIAGKERKLFDSDRQALAWLEGVIGPQPAPGGDWPMFAGSPARYVAGADSNPFLRPKYRVATETDSAVQAGLQAIGNETRQLRRAAISDLCPLLVGRTVLFRTAAGLRAVDFATGAVRWEAPLEDALASFLACANAERKSKQSDLIQRGLRKRLWEEHAFGTMSSDGQSVFGLEGMPFDLGADNQAMTVLPDGRRQLPPGSLTGYNLLCAYDVQTGKLKWEVGGPPGIAGNRLAGTYFLGPPLPLDDQLYVAAESQEQTKLFVLHPGTGAVVSEWVLTVHEEPSSALGMFMPWQMNRMPQRQTTAGPAFGDGVLVCCTSDYRYLGVSLVNGSVLWVYEGQQQESFNRFNFFAIQMRQSAPSEKLDRWCDAGMIIAAGHVLLTPPNSDQLVCLRLADGQQAWSAPRSDGLYVGGVHEDKVLVVGRKGLRALKLADGQPAWHDDVNWPGGAITGGRGYLGATRYYVPLTNCEVAAVDLAKGESASRTRSTDGAVPGNLVSCRGAVVSQSVDLLCRFDLLPARLGELETELAKRPQDAGLLVEYGEALLAQGRHGEAIERLRAALKAERADRAQQLLADAIAEALRLDFAKFRPMVDEIDRLLDKPEHRSRLLRELALGCQRAGQGREAIENYLKWIDLIGDAKKLEQPDAARVARSDRLAQAGLAELWAAAKPEDRAELDRRIASRLRDDQLPQYLALFGFHPSANDVRLRLAKKYLEPAKPEDKHFLEAELLLERVAHTGSPAEQREAAARLAALVRDAGRPEEVAPTDPWPAGLVKKEARKQQANQPRAIYNRMPLWLPDGNRSFSIVFASDGQSIQERSPQGQVRWQLPVADLKVHPQAMGYLYNFSDGCLAGHLLVAALGNRAAAIDTFAVAGGDPKNPKAKLLWAQDSPTTNIQPNAFHLQAWRRRLQMQRQAKPLASALPAPIAATAEYVCFEQDHKLLAVEPLTGRTLWAREGLDADTDLFGDEELIFATSPESTEALVICGLDGRELGRRQVPPLNKRVMTLGRRVLTWETGKQADLTLFDPWARQVIWQRHFDPTSQLWPIGRSEVGVLDPGGNFAVVNLAAGELAVKAQVEPLESLDGLVVLRSGGRYTLLTNRPDTEPNPFGNVVQSGNVMVGGWAHGFNAAGAKLWSAQLPTQNINVFQPQDLPVLFLYRQHMKATPLPNGGFQGGQWQGEVFCLDTRNGKALHEDATQDNNLYEVDVDPGRRIEFHSNSQSVTLTFPGPAPGRPGAR